jgi:hypothetical protein
MSPLPKLFATLPEKFNFIWRKRLIALSIFARSIFTRSINAVSTRALVVLHRPTFGGQDAVQLLDKFQKFSPILFDGDLRAKLVNPVAFGLAHRRIGSITVFAVEGMFDVERCWN